MGHLRALLALLVAGLACAAMAPGASAREGGTHQFVGDASSEVSLLTSEQELDFAPLVIHCSGIKAIKTHSKTVFPTLKILVEAKLIKCKSVAIKADGQTFPSSRISVGGQFEIEYLANGEPNATIINKSPVTLTFAGAMEGCVISISPTKPTAQVTYTDEELPTKNLKHFPTGVQQVVSIDNNFTKLNYTVGGGICEAIHRSTGKEGEWVGVLVAGLKNANLSWE